MNAFAHLGASWLLMARTFRASSRQGFSFKEWLTQVYELGNRSVWLLAGGMAFFGGVMVAIAHEQGRKLTGNLALLGPAYFELMIREFGPLMSALLAAARSGAASSAELASMRVSEQLDALEMSAGDPLTDWVAPRMFGSLVAVPLLCVLGTIAATASAALTATIAYGADGLAFADPRFVDATDVLCAVTKTILCALYIPAAAAHRGLTTDRGALGVGRAVTQGVVDACLGCLVIDFVVAMAFLKLG